MTVCHFSGAGSAGSMATTRKFGAPALVWTRNLPSTISNGEASNSKPLKSKVSGAFFFARSLTQISEPLVPSDRPRMSHSSPSVVPAP